MITGLATSTSNKYISGSVSTTVGQSYDYNYNGYDSKGGYNNYDSYSYKNSTT